MHATSSVIIAKVIAAITLTASTAGGIALATTSTPADPHARTTSESTGHRRRNALSLVIASPTSTGSARRSREPRRFRRDGRSTRGRGTRYGRRRRRRPHDTVAEGSAPDRPVPGVGEPSPRTARPARPPRAPPSPTTSTAPRPVPLPGPPGRPAAPTSPPATPTTAGNAERRRRGRKAEKSEKAGTSEDAPDAQADTDGGGTADRGKSGEHRQDG